MDCSTVESGVYDKFFDFPHILNVLEVVFSLDLLDLVVTGNFVESYFAVHPNGLVAFLTVFL